MNDLEGLFSDETLYCDEPLSPNPKTILSMLNYMDNSQDLMSHIFSQSNTQKHQYEQRYGSFGERLGSRIEFQLPPLDKENISPIAPFFRADPIFPSPPISPGFSPSAFLQSPNMLSDSSQIPQFLVTDDRSPKTIEGLDEGHAMEMVSNNDVPDQQPMHVDVPPQEDFDDIGAEEFVSILSNESHVEPIGALLNDSFESETDVNIIFMQEESKDDENKEDVHRDIVDIDVEKNKNEDREIIDADEYEEKHRDQYIIDVDELDDGETSSTKRRLYDQGSHFGAIRKKKQQRVIIQMETEEDNPEDGFRWRKYGQKIVKGSLKPRSYYRCTYDGCTVKKHVERGTKNENLLVTTYDGIHEHHAPTPRSFGPRNQNRASQNMFDQTDRLLGKQPSISSPRKDTRPHFTIMAPQKDMAQFFMTGLSKLPSLLVNQNTSFIHQNDRLVNHNSGNMHQNDDFMHLRNHSLNPNLGLMHWDDQMGNQNSSFINQDYQPFNQDSSLMFKNYQLVNQRDSSFTCWNDLSVNQDPSFMF